MRRTLCILIQEEPGILARIVSLITRKRFKFESMVVSSTERVGITRITIVVIQKGDTAGQLTKQLKKLINVLSITDITDIPCVERELLLLKIAINSSQRTDLLNIINIFKCKIVDFAEEFVILEITANPGKIIALQKLLSKYETVELARTGKIALIRESGVDSESFKYGLDLDMRKYIDDLEENYRVNYEIDFKKES
ncbi:unnamed protein product [Discosporangium mesarthrocarpum]